jgi:hypothetical protein
MSIENPRLDKVPEEDELGPNSVPEQDELRSFTVPEEELLNEEKNKEQEDFQEEPEQKERVLTTGEIRECSVEINEYVVKLKLRIDEITAELKRKISDKERAELETLLEELKFQFTGLSGMAIDMEAGNYDEIIERPVA